MTFYISNLQHQIRCIYTLQVSPFHEPLLAHRKRKKSGACARVFYVREQSSFYSILPTQPSIKIQWPNTLIIQNHTPLQRHPTRSKRVPEKMKAHNAKSNNYRLETEYQTIVKLKLPGTSISSSQFFCHVQFQVCQDK